MLVMADRDIFDGAAFDVEASSVGEVLGGVSMLLMLDRESFDEAGGVGVSSSSSFSCSSS